MSAPLIPRHSCLIPFKFCSPLPILRSMHILVADDEPLIAELLSSVCARGGHQVGTATSAAAALDYVAVCPTDLVIADVEMPGVAPSDFLRAIQIRRPGLPMVAVLTHDEPLLAADLYGEGAIDVLRKPFSMDDLTIRIALVEERLRYVRDLAEETAACVRDQVRVAIGAPASGSRLRPSIALLDRWRELRRGAA